MLDWDGTGFQRLLSNGREIWVDALDVLRDHRKRRRADSAVPRRAGLSAIPRSPWLNTSGLASALQLAPAAGAVVGDNVLDHGGEGGRVDSFALADSHGAGGLVVVATGDNSLRIRDDSAVVEKYVDVVLRRQQRANIALQHEVRTVGALDGLANLGVGGVNQIADLAADGLLPIGQGIDVGVNARVGGVCHGGPTIAR